MTTLYCDQSYFEHIVWWDEARHCCIAGSTEKVRGMLMSDIRFTSFEKKMMKVHFCRQWMHGKFSTWITILSTTVVTWSFCEVSYPLEFWCKSWISYTCRPPNRPGSLPVCCPKGQIKWQSGNKLEPLFGEISSRVLSCNNLGLGSEIPMLAP